MQFASSMSNLINELNKYQLLKNQLTWRVIIRVSLIWVPLIRVALIREALIRVTLVRVTLARIGLIRIALKDLSGQDTLPGFVSLISQPQLLKFEILFLGIDRNFDDWIGPRSETEHDLGGIVLVRFSGRPRTLFGGSVLFRSPLESDDAFGGKDRSQNQDPKNKPSSFHF